MDPHPPFLPSSGAVSHPVDVPSDVAEPARGPLPRPDSAAAGRFRPWWFVTAVVALSAPLWLWSSLSGGELPANLPVSALQVAVPTVVGLAFLAAWEGRGAGRRSLAALVRPPDRGRRYWYLPAALLLPAYVGLAYLLLQWSGRGLPRGEITPMLVLALIGVALVAAALEEVGWTHYLTRGLLRRRTGVVLTGTVVGVVWAGWHLTGYLQVRTLDWALWQCLFTVALRVLMVQLYAATGRCLGVAVVCHASSNVGYALFPVDGSHYDPMPVALLTVLTVAAAAMWSTVRRRRVVRGRVP